MHVTSNASLLLLIILVPAAIAIAYLYYRKAEIKKNQKVFLITLRAVSLTALFVLLLNPVLHYAVTKKNIPLNIFLFDKSKSMVVNNGDSLSVITENYIRKNSDNGRNIIYKFSDKLYQGVISDDSIDNNSTNLSEAISELLKIYSPEDIASLNIISDGNINKGGNPAYELAKYNIPVNYMLVGDTMQKKDVVVSDVYYNKTDFIESISPIKVIINSYGINGKEKITLYEDGKEISYQMIDLQSNKNSYEVSFSTASEKPGIKRYTVRCEDVDGEISYKNNYRDFYVKYTDNKINLLVISGSPSADFALLKSEIARIQNFRVKYLTEKSPDTFYESDYTGLGDNQCVIMIGFPTQQTSDALVAKISGEIASDNIPIFYIDGGGLQPLKLKKFESALSFNISDEQPSELRSGLRASGSGIYKSSDLVNGFPPVFLRQNCFDVKAGSDIYIMSDNPRLPVLSVYKSVNRSGAAFLAYNFYKWRLSKQVYDYGSFMNDLLTKTVSAIVNPDNNKIKLIPDNDIMSVNMKNGFTVRLNKNESAKTDVKVFMNGINSNIEIPVVKSGDGNYYGTLTAKEKGEYVLTAELHQDGVKTAEDVRKIFVDENNTEYLKTKSDGNILMNIASLTGGKKLISGELSDNGFLSVGNENKQKEYKQEVDYNLRDSFILFLIIIFPIILEWYLRKKFYKLQ
jgi:hypothetical protein